jgi:hypothetical protein
MTIMQRYAGPPSVIVHGVAAIVARFAAGAPAPYFADPAENVTLGCRDWIAHAASNSS